MSISAVDTITTLILLGILAVPIGLFFAIKYLIKYNHSLKGKN